MAETDNELTWTASEYIDHHRGFSWYLALTAITLALSLASYLLFKDIFSSVVMLLLGLAVVISSKRKPRLLTYSLNSKGIHIGEKFHPYSSFHSFAIEQEGALRSLVLVPFKRFTPPISVFFEGSAEDKIVETISHHLPLEQRSHDKIDILSRRLKF